MVAHAVRIDTSSPEKILHVNGAALLADPSGALYWPQERLLVVADLHLEKGSSFARKRVFLPPYDSTATLAKLAAVVGRLNPRRIVALGDSFHDSGGSDRLLPHDVDALRAIQAGREWLWIAGNHDPAPPPTLEGDHATQIGIGPLVLRHHPSRSPGDGEIAGHLHPVAVVGGKAGTVRRRCFVSDGMRCLAPAFGAYTGGLNFLAAEVRALFAGPEHLAHVLGRSAVYTVARKQCLADSVTYEPWL